MVDENSTPYSREYYEALLKSTKDICDLKLQENKEIILEKDRIIEEKNIILLENDIILQKNAKELQEKDMKLEELQSEIELSKTDFQESEAERAKIASSVEQTEEARRAADKKLATCTVCKHYYTDPVVTNCGHSFCRGCVEESVDKFKDCPECDKEITSVCPSILLTSLADSHHMEDVAELVARCSSSIVRNGMRGGYHERPSKELLIEIKVMLTRLHGDPLYELLTLALTYFYLPVNVYYSASRIIQALSLDEVYYATNGDCLQLSTLAGWLQVYTMYDPKYKPAIKRNLTLLDKNNRGGMSYLLRNIRYHEYSVFGECLSCSSDNTPSDADVAEGHSESSQTDTTNQDNSVESVVGKCSTCSQTLPSLPADRKVEAISDLGAFRWLDRLDELAVEDHEEDLKNFFFGLTTVEQDTTKDLLANWAVYRLLGKEDENIPKLLHWSGQYRPVQVSC